MTDSKPASPVPAPLRLLGGIAAIVLTLGLVACGSDDGGSTTGADTDTTVTEGVSLDEYADEVNGLASSFNTEFTALGEEAANPSSAEAYTKTVSQLEDLLDGFIADLEAIEPPEEVASIHDEIITTYGDLNASFAEVREAVESGDSQVALEAADQLQQESTALNDRLNELAQEATDAGADISGLNQAPDTSATP